MSADQLPRLCCHRPSMRAYVRLGGRQIYCGPWDRRGDRPADAAVAVYRRLLAEHLAGGDADTQRLATVAELVAARWRAVRATYAKHGRPTSEVARQRTALRYMARWADVRVDAFGPLRLRAVRAAMLDDGLARTTINAYVGRVRQAFAWAAESELIDPIRYERLLCVRPLRAGQGGRETADREAVAWALVAAVEPYVPPAVWAMVRVQWLTGMRPGEVVALRGDAIDRRAATWWYAPPAPKSEHAGRARRVAIGPRAQEVLRPWLDAADGGYLFRPGASERGRNAARRAARATPVPPSGQPAARRRRRGRRRRRYGPRYAVASYRQAIRRAARRAARDAWRADHPPGSASSDAFEAFAASRAWVPHQLRHAFATRARAVFGDVDPVRAALGHSAASTSETYAQIDAAKAADVARMVG